MNAQELQTLIEAIKSVSGTAQEVLIWWFVFGIAKEVLWAGVVLTALTLLYKAMIKGISKDEDILISHLYRIGAALGSSCGEIEFQTISWNDFDKMYARIGHLQRLASQADELYREKGEHIGRMVETLNRIDNRMEFKNDGK